MPHTDMLQRLLPCLAGTVTLGALLVAALVRFVTSVPVDGWSRAFAKAFRRVLLAGIVAYALSYVVLAPGIFEATKGIPKTVYAIMQTVSIQAPVDEVVDIMRMTLGRELDPMISLLPTCYEFLLVILAIAMPFVVVSTAISSLHGQLQHLRFLSYRKKHQVVYVFAGLSNAHVSLAQSILDNRNDSSQPELGHRLANTGVKQSNNSLRPLIVFCSITGQLRSDNSDLLDSLFDRGKGDVVLTQNSMSELVDELMEFQNVHCFLFTDDHSENMETTADLIDTVSRACVRKASSSSTTNVAKAVEQLAMRFSIYCTHENCEDELFFDSLAHQNPEAALEDAAALSTNDCAHSLLIQQAQQRIEVRLVSLTQERVFDALTNHPLYEVLDPIDAHDTNRPAQDLWVIVVGLGNNGMAAIETAYWMGRLHSVRLHILGIDANGSAIERQLRTTRCEMMSEMDTFGEHVVRIREADAFSPDFDELIRSLPRDSRIYAMVMLGDDQLNLNVALSLRRTFDDLMIEGKLIDPGADRRPMVLPLIGRSETFQVAKRMLTDRDEPFEITPFGRNQTVFSFHNIVVAPWEQYAIAMASAYLEMDEKESQQQSLLRGTQVKMSYSETLVEYNKYEIKKLSNRTNVRHIPYRLWSLGIDPESYFDERGIFHVGEFTNERWFSLLDIDAQDADYLLRQPNTQLSERITKVRLQRLRNEFPAVCRLADLEHDRWMAFYRSQGWRDLTIDECQRLVDMGIIKELSVHQSPKLKRHCYLCDIDTLVSRGVALQKDPFVYDRAAIVEIQRILTGDIFAAEE